MKRKRAAKRNRRSEVSISHVAALEGRVRAVETARESYTDHECRMVALERRFDRLEAAAMDGIRFLKMEAEAKHVVDAFYRQIIVDGERYTAECVDLLERAKPKVRA